MDNPEQTEIAPRPRGRPPKKRHYQRPHTSLLVSCKGIGKRWMRGQRLTVPDDISADEAQRRVELGQMIWLDGLTPSEIAQWLEFSAYLRSRTVSALEAKQTMNVYDLLTRAEREILEGVGDG